MSSTAAFLSTGRRCSKSSQTSFSKDCFLSSRRAARNCARFSNSRPCFLSARSLSAVATYAAALLEERKISRALAACSCTRGSVSNRNRRFSYQALLLLLAMSLHQSEMHGEIAQPFTHGAERVGRHFPRVCTVGIGELVRDLSQRWHVLGLRHGAHQDHGMFAIEPALADLVVDANGGSKGVAQPDGIALGPPAPNERRPSLKINDPPR